jgi:hypothetical protein
MTILLKTAPTTGPSEQITSFPIYCFLLVCL